MLRGGQNIDRWFVLQRVQGDLFEDDNHSVMNVKDSEHPSLDKLRLYGPRVIKTVELQA